MNHALPAVLAIDGGNSKTDVALVAQDGTLLARVRGPGMPTRLGAQTVRVIDDLVRDAAGIVASTAADRDNAGHTGSDGHAGGAGRGASGPGETSTAFGGLIRSGLTRPVPALPGLVAAQLVGCVANADLPAEERQLQEMLHDQGWTESTVVANDTYAVLRAGLDDVPAAGASSFWGVGITCGTGINCVGTAPDGRTAGFLALGVTTGDWGGGSSLGHEAQWHAVRAADGRGPQTALRHAVPAHFGFTEPLDLAEAIHRGTISRDRLADLAPAIFAVADSGDEVARDLVLRLARELFLLARSTITRLGLASEPVPVVIGGGVVASGNPLLIESATSLITTEFPAADVRVLLKAPVAGASLLGLDLAGATVAAKQRLRDAFDTRAVAAARSGAIRSA